MSSDSGTRTRHGNKTVRLCSALALLTMMLGAPAALAQVTVTNPGNTTPGLQATYTSLAAAITDLNLQTAISGPVVITLTGNETAPAGGYSITATPTGASATNNMTIQGSGSTITASAAHTVGALTDAIFKIIGADFITIQNFTMQENAANTVTTPASNTMTEWGVALLHASTTNGAQNNTVQNNTISLNKTYLNTWGVYCNNRHSATVVGTTEDVTNNTTGPNSGNQVFGNTISNVNMGIAFIGTSTAANQDIGNDVGGSSALTGNAISNWGGAAAASTYVSNSGTSYCIYMNHQVGDNVSYNTITSATISGTSVTLRGIFKDYTVTGATIAGTTNITNNTLTITDNFTSGTLEHIRSQGTVANTSTANISNNTILNSSVGGASSSTTMVGIINSSAWGTLNLNNNVLRGNTSTATTGGFTGISNTGAVVTAINMNNNQVGNASGGAITFSAGTSGTVTGITNSGGAATAALSMQGNDVRGITHSVAGSSSHTYIINSAATLSQNISNNTFTNLNVNTTASVVFLSDNATAPAAGSKVINGNSIVTAFNKGGAGGTVTLYNDGASSVCTTPVQNNNNNFSNITVTGATTVAGWFNNDGTGGTPAKIITGNTFTNWTCGTGSVTVLNSNFGNTNSYSNNTVSNITGQGSITGMQVGSSGTVTGLTMASNAITGLSSTGTGGTVTGISSAYPGAATISSNTISNLSSTSTTATVAGITSSGTTPTITGNTISTLTTLGTTSGVCNGIMVTGGTTVSVTKNMICDLSTTGAFTTTPGVNGIVMSGGTTVNATNNLIGDLRAPASASTDAIRGISVTSTTASSTYNVYYNTVYLAAASSGANFGTSGVYHAASTTATTAALTLRNNAIVNNSTPVGTGLTVAFRRSAGTANMLNNYGSASNNNDFYAGAPGPSNLIYYDVVSNAQTIAAYKAGVFTAGTIAPRDTASFTENPPFLSLSCGTPTFLHVNTAVPTALEGGAVNIGGIVDDFDGNIRQGNPGYTGTGLAPDVGGDEFNGIPAVLQGACCVTTGTGCVFVDQPTCLLIGTNWQSGVPCPGTCPPANDLCANAVTLATNYAYVGGTTVNATNDGAATCDPGGVASRDVWYTVTLAGLGILQIDTCTSAIDTVLSVYSGTCASPIELACNDDCGGSPCGPTGSCLVTACLNAGTYLIRVSDKGIGGGGAFNIRAAVVPCNDTCNTATVITTLPFTDAPNGAFATDDVDVTCNTTSATVTKSGVWYTYTPLTNCTASLAETSTNDTVTAIFTGSCGGLTQVACSDPESSSFAMTAGTQYWILVGMWGTTAPTVPYGFTFDCLGPPSNDLCTGATVISSLPYTNTVNGAAATDDLDVTCNSSSGTVTKSGIWYQWTAPSNCPVYVEQLASLDTIRAVFTGTCAGLTQVACIDSETGSPTSFTPTAGTTYYILLGMWGTSAPGTPYQFKLSNPPPANDGCATATTVTVTSGSGTATGDNSCGATDDGLVPSCGATSKDLWWKFTTGAAQAGNWRLDTCGSAIDTILSVYSGSCTGLTEIGCDDDATGVPCSGPQSAVTVALAASTQYWARVATKGGGGGGAITLRIVYTAPPANDNCASPTTLTVSGTSSCPTGTASGSNEFATVALDPAAPPMCATAEKDVFYSVAIPASPSGTNLWIFETCTGTTQDTVLQVLGTCSGPDLGCNDDTVGCGSGTQSRVTVALPASSSVIVRVASKGTGALGGAFTLTVALAPPPNDLCSNATPVSEGVIPWYNLCASTDGIGWGVAAGCDATDSATNCNSDVWFLYSATCTATTTITTCNANSSDLSDTVLVVYPAGTCPPPDASKLACDDDVDAPDACGTLTLRSTVHFAAVKGTQYLVRVGSFSATTKGTGTLTITQPPDTTAPSITQCAADQSASADANCQAAVPDFTAGVVATDNCSGTLTVTQNPTAGTLVGLGPTTVTLTVTDAATNQATCQATFTVNDTTAPSISQCAGNQTASADANCQAAVPDFTTGVVASDNCTAVGNLVITQNPTAGTLVGLGQTAVTLTVTDAANNQAQCQATFTVNDTTPPATPVCPSDISVPTDPGQPNAVVSWTPPTPPSDNCGLASFGANYNPGDTFPIGQTSVTYTAIDNAMNQSTCTFTVTVYDNQAPVFQSCPMTITVNADPGQCSAVVSWTEPTATDNSGQPITPVRTDSCPANGAAFAVGTCTVIYTATDAANNVATCQFNVTVVDNQDPVINDCPSAISVGTDPGLCTAVVSWTEPTASDNCGIQSLTPDFASGSTFPLGPTTVTYTATDVNGRTSTCSFVVTVSDTEAPSITQCAADQSASADANCQAPVPDFTAGVVASDNCTAQGNLVITQNPTVGTLVGPGATTVTLTVADAANNQTPCQATFTVTDTTPPSFVSCPANIVANTNAPNCAAVVGWTAPTASDNCPGVSIQQTQGPPSGSSFANGSVTTIEYTATDGANLTATCSFTVTVTATPDIDNDGDVDVNDIAPFVQVLLGLDNDPLRVARSDANCDGAVNGLDVASFVDALLP